LKKCKKPKTPCKAFRKNRGKTRNELAEDKRTPKPFAGGEKSKRRKTGKKKAWAPDT